MKRIPLTNGDEYDALTGWRKRLKWRAGQVARIKRRYRRRERRVTRAAVFALLALTACTDRAGLLDPSIRYIEMTPQQIAAQSCLAGLPRCKTSAALLLTDGNRCTVLLPPPSRDDERIINGKNADCYRSRLRQEAAR